VCTDDLPATHVQNPHYITHWGILVSVGSASVGAYNGVEIVFPGQRRSPHLSTGVNLYSDSLGGIQPRVGRKSYKCLISSLFILTGFLGMENRLGMFHLTFCQWEWVFRTLVPLLKTATILYSPPPESGAA
jgi:hypothetical protein